MLVAFDAFFRELDIATLDGQCGKREAERIGAEVIHHDQGIDDIAPGLAHLLTLGIPHQGMNIHLAERHLLHAMKTHHHHAGHPEEEDIERGHQHRGGIEASQFRGILGPAQG